MLGRRLTLCTAIFTLTVISNCRLVNGGLIVGVSGSDLAASETRAVAPVFSLVGRADSTPVVYRVCGLPRGCAAEVVVSVGVNLPAAFLEGGLFDYRRDFCCRLRVANSVLPCAPFLGKILRPS